MCLPMGLARWRPCDQLPRRQAWQGRPDWPTNGPSHRHRMCSGPSWRAWPLILHISTTLGCGSGRGRNPSRPGIRDKSVCLRISPQVIWRNRSRCWRQLRLMTLRGYQILLCPFQGGLREDASAHAGEHDRDHRGRDSTIQRRPQHIKLDPALLQPQLFLPPLFLFLSPLLLLRFCDQPCPHGFVSSLTLPMGCRR